jgi:phospholipid/cholesterol/gamma-HCH transport system permease protein
MSNTYTGSTLNQTDFEFEWKENILFLRKCLILTHVDDFVGKVLKDLQKYTGSTLIINLDALDSIDSSGVTSLYYIREKSQEKNISCRMEGGSESIRKKMKIFKRKKSDTAKKQDKIPYFALLGDYIYYFYSEYVVVFLTLTANVIFWSITDIFKSKTHRKGEFYNQAVHIGVNAVYIVIAMAFIIGLVLALQSVAQLRNFGANIFIVDLTVIAMHFGYYYKPDRI